MYSNADFIVTPRPLHMADEMIMWCYSKPPGFYEDLKYKYGDFNLAHYWGPLASHDSSDWIVKAALDTMNISARISCSLIYHMSIILPKGMARMIKQHKTT